MSVGDNSAAARVWFPGEVVSINNQRQETTVPVDEDAAEATSRAAVNTRVSTLSTRLVASGILPTGV